MASPGVTALPNGRFRHDWCGKEYRTETLAARCTDAAPDAGQNARQMVLNRDPAAAQTASNAMQALDLAKNLQAAQAQLDALSAQYQGALSTSVSDRQGLHVSVDQLNTSVAALQAGAAASVTDRTAIHVQLDKVAADLATQTARITTAVSDLAALTSRMTAAEGKITTLTSDLAALTARVAASEARVVEVRMRSAAVPLLALGGQQAVTVTWRTPFGGAVYDVEAELMGIAIGSYTYTVTSKTATGCVVTVKATVAIAASTILVQGKRYA